MMESRRHALLVLLALCLCYILSFFHRSCTAVLSMDLVQALDIDPTSVSLLASATMLGFAIAQIPAGILTDRWGGRKTLTFYQILAALSCGAFALAHTLDVALLSRFCLGLALAVSVPGMKILAETFSDQTYTKAASAFFVCPKIGTLLATAPLAYAATTIGWRWSMLGASLLTFGLAALLWLLLKTPAPTPPALQPAGVVPKKRSPASVGISLRYLLGKKNYLLVCLWYCATLSVLFALSNIWWGAFFMQGMGLSQEAAGGILSVMALVPLPFIPLVAILSDNVFHSRKWLLVIPTLGNVLLLALLVWWPEQLSTFWLTVIGTIMVICTSPPVALSFTIVKESIPAPYLGLALGLFTTGAPVAAALLQPLFGTLVQRGIHEGKAVYEAYTSAFALFLGMMVLAFLASLLVKETFGTTQEAT